MTFATGKAVLSSTAKSALAKFAAQMTTNDMINTDILIKGHTDNTGSAAINEKLSLQRAEAVSKVLKANGISSVRLSEEGCSYNEPVASNNTAEGRKENRRVEVYVLATQAMIDQYANDSSL
jgi:outer membrane protein OmpA-like peptidoglycan-associated protein